MVAAVEDAGALFEAAADDDLDGRRELLEDRQRRRVEVVGGDRYRVVTENPVEAAENHFEDGALADPVAAGFDATPSQNIHRSAKNAFQLFFHLHKVEQTP